jgi:hypothetical protein
MKWTPDLTSMNLEDIYNRAEQMATDAIAQYTEKKEQKATWSRRLRAIGLTLATAGWAVPIVALATRRTGLGNFGYLLLALAAGAVAYDRFYGCSTAWRRYLTTAIALRASLAEFQIAWAKQQAAIGAHQPDGLAIQGSIDLAQSFVKNAYDLIRAEADDWQTDFHAQNAELERRLSQQEPGSARI